MNPRQPFNTLAKDCTKEKEIKINTHGSLKLLQPRKCNRE
jgi:hypothetical protein